MSDYINNNSGFDTLGRDARVEDRMRTTGKDAYSHEQQSALLEELEGYKLSRRERGKAMSWAGLCKKIGIKNTTLTEIRRDYYKGDTQKYLRLIDDFLADERNRSGRFDGRSFAKITITEKIFGVIRAAIRHNSMAVIIGESGDGKSAHARAFQADREGVVLIRVGESHGDQRGVTALLADALKIDRKKITHKQRVEEIIEHLKSNRNIVLVVDEAQKLRPDGLEVIRDIHDASDSDCQSNLPVIFFGDHDFYKLIVRARHGEPSPIKPQMTRRMYPVLNLTTDGADGDGELFTVQDILKILKNSRVRIVTDEAARWLCSLSNTRGYGSLGFAVAVARLAFDITSDVPIGVEALRLALRMAIGPRAAEDVDRSAGGELLRAVG